MGVFFIKGLFKCVIEILIFLSSDVILIGFLFLIIFLIVVFLYKGIDENFIFFVILKYFLYMV